MNIYIARQPIYQHKENVFAYELLYRNNDETHCSSNDLDKETISVVLNSFIDMGIDSITSGKKALINFTENTLYSNIFDILPPGKVIISISSNISHTDKLFKRCVELKRAGYSFCFDNFVFKESLISLLQLVSYIKIDFQNTDIKYQRLLINKLSAKNISFIACNLETSEDLNLADNLGYKFYQGFYFSKPSIIKSKKIPMSTLTKFNLLNEINSTSNSIDQLEKIIKTDISLSVNILKIINSAKYALKSEIKTIKHAICMLGVAELKKWVHYLLIQSESTDSPPELFKLTIIRGKFAELIAKELNRKDLHFDAFIMGILSLLDRILDISIDELLNHLFVSSDVKDALLGNSSNILYKILKIVKYYEKGDWDSMEVYLKDLNLDADFISSAYLSSLAWVEIS